jgi:predicted DNA-binding transcriptional regulator AlpA
MPSDAPKPHADGLEPLVSTRRLRELLDVSDRRLRTLRSAGKLPPVDVRLGKALRWKASTIRTWMDSLST